VINPGPPRDLENDQEAAHQLKFKQPIFLDKPENVDGPGIKLNPVPQSKTHEQETEDAAYQLKFKPINFIDKPEEASGVPFIKLRKVVQTDEPKDSSAGPQIQLRHVEPGTADTEVTEATTGDPATNSGAMKRGAPPPPPPGGKGLMPSQLAQWAAQQQQMSKKPVSLADELSSAVRNARQGLRKVIPPAEKNYALEEKITITPFSHFAKSLEEHTITSEEVKEKLAKAEFNKQQAQSAPIDEFYSLEVLQNQRPEHCVVARLHLYLSDAEFQEVFQLDKAAFAKLPLWKQNEKRKQAHLF